MQPWMFQPMAIKTPDQFLLYDFSLRAESLQGLILYKLITAVYCIKQVMYWSGLLVCINISYFTLPNIIMQAYL